MAGKFYVVATPIGNLEDVTLRALRILKEVDAVLCEDTRHTSRLLQKYGIENKLISYASDDLATREISPKLNQIFNMLKEDKTLAFTTDAGTPGISDPGSLLVAKIRENLSEVKIESVPGPSALTSAFSIAGMPLSEFAFLGFIPHKKGRKTIFEEIANGKRPYIFYESPHRILKTLASLEKKCPERKIAIARELTKIYEEMIYGSPAECIDYLTKNPDKRRGEFTVMVQCVR